MQKKPGSFFNNERRDNNQRGIESLLLEDFEKIGTLRNPQLGLRAKKMWPPKYLSDFGEQILKHPIQAVFGLAVIMLLSMAIVAIWRAPAESRPKVTIVVVPCSLLGVVLVFIMAMVPVKNTGASEKVDLLPQERPANEKVLTPAPTPPPPPVLTPVPIPAPVSCSGDGCVAVGVHEGPITTYVPQAPTIVPAPELPLVATPPKNSKNRLRTPAPVNGNGESIDDFLLNDYRPSIKY